MKKMTMLLGLLALCFSFSFSASGEKKTLQFDGETYSLAYSEGNNGGLWINEYLRAGETFDNYTKLIGVRDYGATNLTPKEAVENVAQNLNASNPLAKYRILSNKSTGEATIDFLTWPADGSYMEFNAFKFTKRNGVLLSYQFVYREKELETMRAAMKNKDVWVNKVIAQQVPDIVKTIQK